MFRDFCVVSLISDRAEIRRDFARRRSWDVLTNKGPKAGRLAGIGFASDVTQDNGNNSVAKRRFFDKSDKRFYANIFA